MSVEELKTRMEQAEKHLKEAIANIATVRKTGEDGKRAFEVQIDSSQ